MGLTFRGLLDLETGRGGPTEAPRPKQSPASIRSRPSWVAA